MDKYYHTKKRRLSGYYWVPDKDTIAEHFCRKMLEKLKHQQRLQESDYLNRQKEIHRDLLSIRASKGKHGGGYVNKKRNIKKDDTETFQDMIDKFKDKRKEQTVMEELLRERRKSLEKLNDKMQERTSAKLWDIVKKSQNDTKRLVDSSDNIVNNMWRTLNGAKRDRRESLAEDISLPRNQDDATKKSKQGMQTHTFNPNGNSVASERRVSIQKFNKINERKQSDPRVILDEHVSIEDFRIENPHNINKAVSYGLRKNKTGSNNMILDSGLRKESPLEPGDLQKSNHSSLNIRRGSVRNDRNTTDESLKDRRNSLVNRTYLKKNRRGSLFEDGKVRNRTEMEKEYSLSFEMRLGSGKSSPTEDSWRDVKKCRYLRGYDPPEMVMPDKEVNLFVFGRDENDILDLRREERNRSVSTISTQSQAD